MHRHSVHSIQPFTSLRLAKSAQCFNTKQSGDILCLISKRNISAGQHVERTAGEKTFQRQTVFPIGVWPTGSGYCPHTPPAASRKLEVSSLITSANFSQATYFCEFMEILGGLPSLPALRAKGSQALAHQPKPPVWEEGPGRWDSDKDLGTTQKKGLNFEISRRSWQEGAYSWAAWISLLRRGKFTNKTHRAINVNTPQEKHSAIIQLVVGTPLTEHSDAHTRIGGTGIWEPIQVRLGLYTACGIESADVRVTLGEVLQLARETDVRGTYVCEWEVQHNNHKAPKMTVRGGVIKSKSYIGNAHVREFHFEV